MDVKATTAAELKLIEIERKKQIASEVNPSLKDIQTIRRRINNLKKKLLIQDIEKNLNIVIPEDEQEAVTLTLNDIDKHFGKLDAKIQLKLESL